MEVMYGVKVLNKLIDAWNAQEANREYLRDHTVPSPPTSPLLPFFTFTRFFRVPFPPCLSVGHC